MLLADSICKLVFNTVEKAISTGAVAMQELVSGDTFLPGNFVFAKPDQSVFALDTTQAQP